MDMVQGEGVEAASSASAELARALGRNPRGEMSEANEELEPVETRDARRAPTPSDPTSAEVENHQLTGHAVFRSWCRHCVRGRGREAAHSSTARPEGSLPILSWDYCYLSSKRQSPSISKSSEATVTESQIVRDCEGETPSDSVDSGPLESPVLVMFDSKGKGIHARLMPAKGVDFEGLDCSLKLWAGDLDRLGYKRHIPQ